MKILTFVLAQFLISISSFAGIADSLTQLRFKEANLVEEYKQLQQSNFTTENIYLNLSVPPNEQTKLFLKNADQAFSKFQTNYDNYNNEKLDYFGERAWDQVRTSLEALISNSEVSSKELSKLSATAVTVEQALAKYQSLRHLFGVSGDHLRIMAYRDIFKGTKKFMSRSLKAQGLKAPRRPVPIKEAISLFPDIVKALWTLQFKRTSGPGETPVINSLGMVWVKLGKKMGTDITWQGRENLPSLNLDGKTFNIYVFNHTNPYYDNLAMALLGTKGVAVFGAAEITFPKFIAKRLVKSDDFFVVANDEDLTVIDKVVRLTRAGKVQGGFLAAEGYTGVGMYETRPIRKPFATLLLKKLKEQGLTVNLIPITLPDGFRIMNEWVNPLDPNPNDLEAFVHPIMTHEMTGRLSEMTGDELSITRVIRSIWMERLRTDEEVFLSMPPLDVVQARLDKLLFVTP